MSRFWRRRDGSHETTADDAVERKQASVERDEAPFELRLVETIAWCATRADPRLPNESLRSAVLGSPVTEMYEVPNVKPVAEARAALLADARPSIGSTAAFQAGRLLASFPDENLLYGLAVSVSRGFFDEEDVTPWDTWIAVLNDPARGAFLVSWVPLAFERLVSATLEVQPDPHCNGSRTRRFHSSTS